MTRGVKWAPPEADGRGTVMDPVRLLQLAGQGAFLAASVVLGLKLLRLWHGTRELPELTLGLSFLLGGGFGYVAWFAEAACWALGRTAPEIHPITLAGLVATCLGAITHGLGVAVIFRPGTRWPFAILAVLALWMAGACWSYFLAGYGSMTFWAAVLAVVPIYAWAAAETSVMAREVHRRARFGLADPVVAHRLAQWGLFCLIIVLMTGVSFVSRLLNGPVMLPWLSAVIAALGGVAATAIWLGFFPPRAVRERLASAYAE